MTRSLGSLAALLAGLYVFHYFAFPTYTHRFRLTFQVEVDGKLKEGSGVITVYDQDNKWVPLTQKRWKRTSSGPSPWMDLGKRGMLLAAMRPYRASYEPRPHSVANLSFVAFFGGYHGSIGINSQTVQDIHKQTGKRRLKDDQLPEFIWLPNPQDPTSASIVQPEKFSEEIGNDVRFAGAYVEITTERPDNSLYEKLPWLASIKKEQALSWHTITPEEFKLGAHNLLGDY